MMEKDKDKQVDKERVKERRETVGEKRKQSSSRSLSLTSSPMTMSQPTMNNTSKKHQLPEWVTLDIGGKLMKTTRSTLVKDPSSMLAKMFSSDSAWSKSGEAYSLDCDHRYFRVILNFLRYNELIVEENLSKRGVLVLARYFQIQKLIDLLEPYYGDIEWVTVLEDDFSTTIDEKKWKLDLSRVEAKIDDSIYGQMVLINRAVLITVQQYPPRVRITGTWRCIDQEDSLHIFTRCDGHFGDNGRTMGCGLEFFAMKQRFLVLSRGSVPKATQTRRTCNPSGFKIQPNRDYAFEVIDAITNLQWVIHDVETPEIFVKVEGKMEQTPTNPYNHISIYNRERTGGPMISILSDVRIEQWNPQRNSKPF